MSVLLKKWLGPRGTREQKNFPICVTSKFQPKKYLEKYGVPRFQKFQTSKIEQRKTKATCCFFYSNEEERCARVFVCAFDPVVEYTLFAPLFYVLVLKRTY